MNKKHFYETSDLALTTALSLFYPIEGIDKNNVQRVIFYFQKDKSLDEFLERYCKRELKIEHQSYFKRLKIIKTRLYAER